MRIRDLIDELQALPEEDKKKPIYLDEWDESMSNMRIREVRSIHIYPYSLTKKFDKPEGYILW
jgi:hypothetical protein